MAVTSGSEWAKKIRLGVLAASGNDAMNWSIASHGFVDVVRAEHLGNAALENRRSRSGRPW